MSRESDRKRAKEVFAALTEDGSVPMAIMNARRENTAPPYDGEKLLETLTRNEDRDFAKYRRSIQQFGKNSVPRG